MIENSKPPRMIANLVLGVVFLSFANSLDFAARKHRVKADQFTIVAMSNISALEKPAVQTTVGLPEPYAPGYDCTLALAGYSLNMGYSIDFEMWLEPFSADSSATISVKAGISIY